MLQVELYARLARDIPNFRQHAAEMLTDGIFDDDRPSYMINLFFTFELEVLCRIQEWQKVRAVVGVSVTSFALFFTRVNNLERRRP
jgi:hypothetical protein